MLPTQTSEPSLRGVRRAVKQTLFSVGYYHQRLAQISFSGIAVLCYHGVRALREMTPFDELHVTSATFERHCRFLSDSCNPISLHDLRAARAGLRPLPPRPVIITFDDGYRGVLDHALPSLEQHGVPAAVFACADPVLRSHHFWFDVLWRRDGEAAVLRARKSAFATWRALIESIDMSADPSEQHRPMTLAELRRLAASPLIEIGGHTLSHPTLALAPADEQRREIAGCRAALQDALGIAVDSFAYPYGVPAHDYVDETVTAVRNAGFDLAFTTESAFTAWDGDPLQMPRFVMLESVDEVELAHRLVHSWNSTAVVA